MPYTKHIANQDYQMIVNGYEIKPGANLRVAKLQGANLSYAILIGAKLKGAKRGCFRAKRQVSQFDLIKEALKGDNDF
jgi:hypothetical protein